MFYTPFRIRAVVVGDYFSSGSVRRFPFLIDHMLAFNTCSVALRLCRVGILLLYITVIDIIDITPNALYVYTLVINIRMNDTPVKVVALGTER